MVSAGGSHNLEGSTSRLRVLHASPSYAPAYRLGGPVRSLEGLLPALQSAGAEVRVITTDAHGPERLQVPGGWHERDGVPVCYLRRWLAPDITPAMFSAVVTEATQADVVHVTGLFCVPTVLAVAAAKFQKRPVILSPRGALEQGSLNSGTSAAKKLWLLSFEKLLQSVDVFHVTSDKEAHSVTQALGAWARTVVVPNGTLIQSMAIPRRLAGIPRIGALGRIHPNKGYDRLVDACAILRAKGIDFELQIAGPPSDPAYVQKLREQIAFRGLADWATLIGEISGPAKNKFYANCRVFALPSHDTENFGNVVIEALAQETPVVASSYSPWSELAACGCGAWVPNTPEALASALEPYLLDSDYARNHGRRGRELVELKYTWQVAAKSMLEIYHKLCRKKQVGATPSLE